MRSKLNCLLCFLALALPASAQLDSAQLQAKFGAPSHVELRSPLSREIFRVPPGFDLVVDYGVGHQVCKLQVPALMPTDSQVKNLAEMKQKMYAFLADLVPDAMRGTQAGGPGVISLGAISFSMVEYEHVTIIEANYSNQPFSSDNTITVKFKNAACQEPTSH